MSGKETWKKWRIGMSRITKGDLVLVQQGRLQPQTATVLTKPKEKPFQMSPRVTSLILVVDLLLEDGTVQVDVPVSSLYKIDK